MIRQIMSGKNGSNDAFTNPSSAKIEQQRKIMEKIKGNPDAFTNPSSAKIEQQNKIMEKIKKILELEKRKNQLLNQGGQLLGQPSSSSVQNTSVS